MKNALRLFVAALAFVCGCARAQVAGEELFRSIENGDFSEFSRLVGAGVLVSAKNRLGESLLYVAAENESAALMTALIEAGAEINAVNRDGETPLHWAAMTGTFLAVKALADAGADLDAQDLRTGNTALHAAASHNDIVLIHYLLSKNVRTDIRNNNGLTALELAKAGGRASAVRLLEQ